MEAGAFLSRSALEAGETYTTSYEDHGRIVSESTLHAFTILSLENDLHVPVQWTVVAGEKVSSLTPAVSLDRDEQVERYVNVICSVAFLSLRQCEVPGHIAYLWFFVNRSKRNLVPPGTLSHLCEVDRPLLAQS